MLGKRQLLGRSGEQKAAAYLKNCGFKILSRNYSCRHGEIDLIAMDGEVLVFIEVKTRTQRDFGSPASAVTKKKQIQISKVAHNYLIENGCDDFDARFDVVSVFLPGRGKEVVEYIADAFEFCLM